MNPEYIYLAHEAIFPITKDETGKPLHKLPATKFHQAGTLQGEGKYAGVPVLFVRTAGCNLRCMWTLPNGEVSLCDTPYASFDTSERKEVNIDTVKNIILQNLGNINHLVISGGEPFLQPEALVRLIKELKEIRSLHVAIETNGTLFHKELVDVVDFFSISPKLKNSVPTCEKLAKTKTEIPMNESILESKRRNIEVIQSIIDVCRTRADKDFQLKYVVQNHNEITEIEETFLAFLSNWKPEDIILMPLGSTQIELEQTRMITLEAAIERGWRFSPRLHITYFDGISGV